MGKQKLYKAIMTLYENDIISDNLMNALTIKVDNYKVEK